MGFFDSFPFRHGRRDQFTEATRSLIVYILRKITLCNSRTEKNLINTGSATVYTHRLSAISSSGFSIEDTPYNHLMSEA